MSSYFPRVHWSWATSGVQTQGGEKEQLWKNNFRVNTFWSVSVWEIWKLIFVFFSGKKWKALTPSERAPCVQEAEKLRLKHMQVRETFKKNIHLLKLGLRAPSFIKMTNKNQVFLSTVSRSTSKSCPFGRRRRGRRGARIATNALRRRCRSL